MHWVILFKSTWLDLIYQQSKFNVEGPPNDQKDLKTLRGRGPQWYSVLHAIVFFTNFFKEGFYSEYKIKYRPPLPEHP